MSPRIAILLSWTLITAAHASAADCAAYMRQRKELNAQVQTLVGRALDDGLETDGRGCEFRSDEWSIRDERHESWCSKQDTAATEERLRKMSSELKACGGDLDAQRRTQAGVGEGVAMPQSPTQHRKDPLEPLAAAAVGCFKDASAFDLDGYLERSAENTPQRCIALCQDRGFAYAGVQYGESCLCGDSYGRYGRAGEGDCNDPCTGDATQRCGGYSTNMVYKTAGGEPESFQDWEAPQHHLREGVQ